MGHLIFKIQEIIHHFLPLSPCTGSRGGAGAHPSLSQPTQCEEARVPGGNQRRQGQHIALCQKGPSGIDRIISKSLGLRLYRMIWTEGYLPRAAAWKVSHGGQDTGGGG